MDDGLLTVHRGFGAALLSGQKMGRSSLRVLACPAGLFGRLIFGLCYTQQG